MGTFILLKEIVPLSIKSHWKVHEIQNWSTWYFCTTHMFCKNHLGLVLRKCCQRETSILFVTHILYKPWSKSRIIYLTHKLKLAIFTICLYSTYVARLNSFHVVNLKRQVRQLKGTKHLMFPWANHTRFPPLFKQ